MDFLKKVLTDKDIWLGVGMVLIGLFLINNARAEGPTAELFQKPVICAPVATGQSMAMLGQIKADGMQPLLYFRGNSFTGEGGKFNADFFILYDASDKQITVVERQDNGFTCLLSGGTGDVKFDPQIIRDLIGWNDIP